MKDLLGCCIFTISNVNSVVYLLSIGCSYIFLGQWEDFNLAWLTYLVVGETC